MSRFMKIGRKGQLVADIDAIEMALMDGEVVIVNGFRYILTAEGLDYREMLPSHTEDGNIINYTGMTAEEKALFVYDSRK